MIDRRKLVGMTLAGLTALAVKSAEGRTMSGQKIENAVLVHGAWADGSSWAEVIPLLQAAGLKVTAVQNPLSSLADDVAATRRALALNEGATVLVGHSYGGVVISEAGVAPNVAALVYVAALAPDIGEDFGTLASQFPTPPGGAHIRVKDGFAVLDEAGVTDCFAQDLAPAKARVLAATQGPISATLFEQKTTAAAWRDKPSWYAVSKADRMVAPELQQFVAKRMKATTVELDTSHASPVTRPRQIAELILQAAGRSAG